MWLDRVLTQWALVLSLKPKFEALLVKGVSTLRITGQANVGFQKTISLRGVVVVVYRLIER